MLSVKHNSFFRLLKNQGFKDESRTKGGSYAIGTSTTLESNKSQAGLGLLGGEHVQTPQDSDLPLVCGPEITTLPKYIGEPWSRREEHARDVAWLPGWHKTRDLSPPMCAMLTAVMCHACVCHVAEGFCVTTARLPEVSRLPRGGCVWMKSNFMASPHRTFPRWS